MTRVGLYLDLRSSGGAPVADVYRKTLDRVADAERRGLEAVWLSEHHGVADGYLPAPLTVAAAVAARTTTVRVGTAVVIAPLVRPETLAEQAAVVDLISGGRLELGVGAGWRTEEFARAGVPFAGRYDALEHTVRALPGLWADGTVTPAPVQDPLPTWVGARGPRGARLAGRVGAGLLWLDAALLEPYRAGLAEGGHDAARARVGGLVHVLLADDPDAVRSSTGRGNAAYRGQEEHDDTTFPRLRVLTADDAVAAVRARIADLPATDVFCFADLGGLPDDVVDRHLELVTDVLRPALVGAAV